MVESDDKFIKSMKYAFGIAPSLVADYSLKFSYLSFIFESRLLKKLARIS